MLLTIFYMVATWVQSWRLSSLRARLQSILQGPDAKRPSLMLCTDTKVSINDDKNGNDDKGDKDDKNSKDEDDNNCKQGNNRESFKSMLSSHFCNNSNLAKLGDLLWYQGDKRLCTIYPQQKIDVTDWILYPCGKTVFPLFTHNNAQTSLLQNEKMHVLIEADFKNYIPLASSKATKLEDYGLIVTWTSDDILGIILETDLDHITKFSATFMQGQCFINDGLPVTRIESVSVSGKPCVCNYKGFNLGESKKLIDSSQWRTYRQKLKLVGDTARLVSKQQEPIEVEKIPGLVISPGSKPISLQMPTILEIRIPNDMSDDNIANLSVPSTPPPTPASASAIINGTASRLSQALTNSMEINPSLMDLSAGSISNLSTSRSQEFILQESSQENLNESTPLRSFTSKKLNDKDTRMSSLASSRSSLSTSAVNKGSKPPNILIYADSAVASDNVRNVLDTTLKENKYIIYSLSAKEAQNDVWMDQATLMVVCGNVGNDVASQVVEYIVRGGKVLALCSDILKTLLPAFKTAEVRENELVRFSYGKWKHVRMMHHVFCYQASPVKTKFSQDLEESKSATPPTPVSTEISDRAGKSHTFSVKVLGSEETWHTPSILLADLPATGGKAVFSQIHLEADPSQYEFEESKYTALKQSNVTRLEIFSDLLSTHLGVEVTTKPKIPPTYSSGFFWGDMRLTEMLYDTLPSLTFFYQKNHANLITARCMTIRTRHIFIMRIIFVQLKLEMLKRLKSQMQPDDILKAPKIEIQFCGTTTNAKPATPTFLPIMVHRCPENFSTVDYFENLSTEAIGRLVIYADVITSSMDVVSGLALYHGLAVIPQRQTKGQGRGKNIWLSPEGCAMFTLQLHIPLKSLLGERISLIQHLTAVAIVSAVTSIPGYENIDLRIKWPNDIYTSNGSKIGGLIVTTFMQPSTAICNIGSGINLSNSTPTTCINDLISKFNERSSKKLKKLTSERFLALVFSEIESLLNIIQNGNFDHLYKLYYHFWLHTDAEITIIQPDGSSQEVQILGIDSYGYLEVKGKRGNVFTVNPDGNSFDILNGLIAPKC